MHHSDPLSLTALSWLLLHGQIFGASPCLHTAVPDSTSQLHWPLTPRPIIPCLFQVVECLGTCLSARVCATKRMGDLMSYGAYH